MQTDGALVFARTSQVYSDYVFALDGNDAAGVAACFTDDGVWAISGREPIRGREAIQAFVEATAGDRPRHQYANLGIVEVDGDTVRSRAYFTLMSASDGVIVAHGVYADELVPDPGQPTSLLFARRDIEFLWLAESYAARGRAGRSGADGPGGG